MTIILVMLIVEGIACDFSVCIFNFELYNLKPEQFIAPESYSY